LIFDREPKARTTFDLGPSTFDPKPRRGDPSMDNTKVNILVVDDRPERVLTLSAVLEELGENIVGASSGREALRHLLQREFAVILLDVNMPGMDGFETASLIRLRPATRDVPIIFVTAYQDEVQLVQGYSMRAVDYIQVPVVPEILRTKVGVFVDLYKKTAQIQRQAEWLRRRAEQLHKLTSASLAINSALTLDNLLEVVTATARDVLDVHLASATVLPHANNKARTVASASPRYHTEPRGEPLEETPLRTMLCRLNRPVRMTERELHDHPGLTARDKTWREQPLRGWLAAPLTGRDGNNLGWIELSDKADGEFTADDEAILVQLAQMTSIAIDNAAFAQERELNRLKDEFLWTLSHELRTPLNAILGWTQLLAMESVPEATARGLEVIDRNARAQAKLIDDMLDLSRIIMGKLRLARRPIDLRSVVEAAVENIRPLAVAKNLTVEATIVGEPLPLSGDPDRLQQIAWNLLSNALKFTPSGGCIRITLEPIGEMARLVVTDTGQGIKAGFLPHVFERFRQADSSTARSHTGLGIGLTIARHIAELHGGRVYAASPGEGHGSTFTVELPIASRLAVLPEARIARDGGNGTGRPDLNGLEILLVDDDADALQAMGEILKRSGARITTAASAEEALACMRRRRPDVLVSDIGMPQQDGYALVRAIRQLPPESGGQVPAVALTAYARTQDSARALSAGFQVHLAKPVDPAALVQAIAQVRRNGHAPQPAAITSPDAVGG
jgi:signal transduction histidine kinase/response regulator RpfG family c-di-GMP phosphodiesterase